MRSAGVERVLTGFIDWGERDGGACYGRGNGVRLRGQEVECCAYGLGGRRRPYVVAWLYVLACCV
jgi:hypothetical protein